MYPDQVKVSSHGVKAFLPILKCIAGIDCYKLENRRHDDLDLRYSQVI